MTWPATLPPSCYIQEIVLWRISRECLHVCTQLFQLVVEDPGLLYPGLPQCGQAGLVQHTYFPSSLCWHPLYLTFMYLSEREVGSWTLTAQLWCSGRLAKPHMPDFCNLFARPVFMSMLIVGSAVVQLYLPDFERLLFCWWCLASLWVCLKTLPRMFFG